MVEATARCASLEVAPFAVRPLRRALRPRLWRTHRWPGGHLLVERRSPRAGRHGRSTGSKPVGPSHHPGRQSTVLARGGLFPWRPIPTRMPTFPSCRIDASTRNRVVNRLRLVSSQFSRNDKIRQGTRAPLTLPPPRAQHAASAPITEPQTALHERCRRPALGRKLSAPDARSARLTFLHRQTGWQASRRLTGCSPSGIGGRVAVEIPGSTDNLTTPSLLSLTSK